MILQSHPYLIMSLILVVFSVTCLAACPSQRRLMVLSGVLAMPFCLYEFAFIPEYWSPSTVGGGKVGPEDLLFSFSTGGIAWLIATFGTRYSLTVNFQKSVFLRRFVGSSLMGVVFSLIFWVLGVPIMTSILICYILGIVFISWRFPRFHSLVVKGAIGFAIIYTIILSGMFIISPGFISQWNSDNLSGFMVAGTPVEEALWALCFGAVWPRFIAYVLDARPHNEKQVIKASGFYT